MKNFWLERKATEQWKRLKCMASHDWTFNSILEKLKETSQVKVLEVNNLESRKSIKDTPPWITVEASEGRGIKLTTQSGHTIEMIDEEPKKWPEIYGFKTPERHSFKFVDVPAENAEREWELDL